MYPSLLGDLLEGETQLVEVLDHAVDMLEADCLCLVQVGLVVVLKYVRYANHYQFVKIELKGALVGGLRLLACPDLSHCVR